MQSVWSGQVGDAGDKLTAVTGANPRTYTYDACGRTTSITSGSTTTNFSYDYEDRVTEITRSGMTTNSFSYNGSGARVSAVDSLGTRTFARNGVGVTSPVVSDGFANYTPGISERRSGVTRYQSLDIKNATAQVSSSQTVVGTKQYDAFGNLTSSSGSWNGPFSYGGAFGYQSETDTGYQLLGHRYYDPTTGRFLSRDPIGDGRDWYTYCANNPITNVDPDGRLFFAVPLLAKAAAWVGGAIGTAFALKSVIEEPSDWANWVDLLPWSRFLKISRFIAQVDGFGDTARRVSKGSGGRLGGPEHRGTVATRGDELKKQNPDWTLIGGGGKSEKAIEIDGRRRFAEIWFRKGDGSNYFENVGNVKKDGTPVSRELPALSDLGKLGEIVFTPLPRKGPGGKVKL